MINWLSAELWGANLAAPFSYVTTALLVCDHRSAAFLAAAVKQSSSRADGRLGLVMAFDKASS